MNGWQQFVTVSLWVIGNAVSPLLAQTTSLDVGASPTLATPSSKSDLYIAVPLPRSATIASNKAWQLIEIDHPESAIPAQIETMVSGDSTANPTSAQILAVIPPRASARIATIPFGDG